MTTRYLAQGQLDPILKSFGEIRYADTFANLTAGLRALAPMIDHSAIEMAKKLPDDLFAALHDLKLFALTIPKEYEGLGASMYEFCQVMAVVAELDAAMVVTAVPHLGNGVKSVLLFANEAQKRDAFCRLSEERRLVSFAITEDHTGSDVASHKTRVTTGPDGQLHLNGSKTWITNALYAKHLTIVAKSPDLSPIPDASTFLMLKPGDHGFTISKPWEKMGISGSPTVDLFFDDVTLSPERIIGKPGAAMDQFTYVVFSGRIGAAAGGYGLAKRGLRLCAELLPPSARSEALLEEGNYRLFLMKAGIELASFLNDVQSHDLSPATALCKTYCTTYTTDILESLFRVFHDAFPEIPREIAILMREFSVFRVFEGPNEVLNYRAAIDIVTTLSRPLEGETDPSLLLSPELAQLGPRVTAVLNGFAAYLQEKKTTRMLIMQQNLLARVSHYAMLVFCLVACLLKVKTFDTQAEDARQPWTRAEIDSYPERFLAEVEGHIKALRQADLPFEEEVAACTKICFGY